MSLRAQLHLYLVTVHVLFGALAIDLLRQRPIWLLVAEVALVVSLFVGVALVRAVFGPLRLIRTGIEFIRESDFNTRFSQVRSPEMSELIETYNCMMDRLREERIRHQEREHFLRDVITESPSGIVTLDLDGRITLANPSAEELLDARESDLVGKRLDQLGSPFTDELGRLESGASGILRLQGRRRVRCRKLSFMDRGFQRPFLLLEELTDELHRTEKAAYDKLIRMMSHEVNNTCGAVNSLLQSCRVYGDQISREDREDFRHALDVATTRNMRMNLFMQGFADVIRLPAPVRRPTGLRALLEEIVELLGQQAEENGVRWEWQIEREPPPVAVDPTQMEQVFINILKNAIESIAAAGPAANPVEPTGTITIRIAEERERPYVSIRDTGPGMPPPVQEQLFTPFFTTKAQGQGIGLTLVQEILVAHGFEFALVNAVEGGAEFTIRF